MSEYKECDWCTDYEDLVLVPKGEMTQKDNLYLCKGHYGELLSHFPHCKFCTSDAEHQLRGMDLCGHCYEDCLKDEDKEMNR